MKEIIYFFELVFGIMTLDERHEATKLKLKRAQDLYTRFNNGEELQIKRLEKECTESVKDIDALTKEIEGITFNYKMQEFYNCRRIKKELLENEGILNAEIGSIEATLEYANTLKYAISKEETMNLLHKRQKLEENKNLILTKIQAVIEQMDKIYESLSTNDIQS